MKFYRLPDVQARYGISRSTVYKWISEDKFPSPVMLGPRVSAWPEEKLDQFDETILTQNKRDASL
ncbi:MAG: AlpA family phage regulatory protein [Deltaproteobacteria bacterium]|nr:AlpA family phage regulatory protein [Deltaproteobacteria bacterium]